MEGTMKLTCKELKFMIGTKNRKIYKSYSWMTDQSEVRIDMSEISKEQRVKIKKWLSDRKIFLYRDDPLHLPFDYVVTY